MPTSVICSNCSADTHGGECCPSCLAPVSIREKRFTIESQALSSPTPVPTVSASATIPNLAKVTFKPSSAFSRAFHKVKGPALSLVLSMAIVSAAGCLWRDWQIGRGNKAEAAATQAFESHDYDKAAGLWEDAYSSYRYAFYQAGQVDALLQSSRSQIELGHFPEALHQIERAGKIKKGTDIEKAEQGVHQAWGLYDLEQAEDYLSNDNEEEAVKHALAAVKELNDGQADDESLAKAHRLAARGYAEQFKFDEADDNINTALDLTGKTELNSQTMADIRELRSLYQQAQKEKARRERYIPDKKLDLIAVAKSIRAKRAERYRYAREYSSNYSSNQSYGRYSFNRHSSQSSSNRYHPSSSTPYRATRLVDAKTDYPSANYPKAGSSSYYSSSGSYYPGSSNYYSSRPSSYNRYGSGYNSHGSSYNRYPSSYNSYSSYNQNRPKASTGPSYPTALPKPKYPNYSSPTYSPGSGNVVRGIPLSPTLARALRKSQPQRKTYP